eukprot:663379-Rhodomonas_salina.5
MSLRLAGAGTCLGWTNVRVNPLSHAGLLTSESLDCNTKSRDPGVIEHRLSITNLKHMKGSELCRRAIESSSYLAHTEGRMVNQARRTFLADSQSTWLSRGVTTIQACDHDVQT